MNAFRIALEQQIGAATTGQPFIIRQRQPAGGGCIDQSWQVSDGDQAYFVKLDETTRLALFEAEAAWRIPVRPVGTP